MMVSSSMKIFNFFLGDGKVRYKLSCNSSKDIIDSTLRKELNIPSNVDYSLIDVLDNAVVDFSSLMNLDNKSNVAVKIKDMQKSTENNSIDLR
jgi:hypothetical protein